MNRQDEEREIVIKAAVTGGAAAIGVLPAYNALSPTGDRVTETAAIATATGLAVTAIAYAGLKLKQYCDSRGSVERSNDVELNEVTAYAPSNVNAHANVQDPNLNNVTLNNSR